jgi:hypothetical protein
MQASFYKQQLSSNKSSRKLNQKKNNQQNNLHTSKMAHVFNALLNPKLFQVIGSTPSSIMETIKKLNIANRPNEGILIATIALFASAVNKATLENFLSDPNMANARPMIYQTLSINNKANMTALTLLGHCFITQKYFDDVTFVTEFRKKLGQHNIWDGNLSKGSISEKQREILLEKQRVTNLEEARLLASCYLKHTGLISSPMDDEEANFFQGYSAVSSIPTVPTRADYSEDSRRATVFPGSTPSPPARTIASSRHAPTISSGSGIARPSRPAVRIVSLKGTKTDQIELPEDVLDYRRNVLNNSDDYIIEKALERGVDEFISGTRRIITSRMSPADITRLGTSIGDQ